MLNKMSIQNKLLFTYIIIGMLSIPSTVFIMYMFKQSNDNFSMIVQNSIPRTYALAKIKEQSDDFMMLAKLSKKNNTVMMNKEQLLAIINEGNKWEAEYQKHTLGLKKNTFLDQKQLDKLEEDFVTQALLVISYYENNANESLIRNEQIKLKNIQESLNTLIIKAVDKETQYWAQEVATAKSDAKKARLFALFSLIAVGFVILIFSVYLTRKIAKPIIDLRDIAIDVSNGNYNIRANINSEDEIGYLATAINSMIVSLSRAKIITEKMQNMNAEKLIYLALFPRSLTQLKSHFHHFFSQVKVAWCYDDILKSMVNLYEELAEKVKSNPIPNPQLEESQKKIVAFKTEQQVDSMLNKFNVLRSDTQKSMELLSEYLNNIENFSIDYDKNTEYFDVGSCLEFVISLELIDIKDNQKIKIDIDKLPKIRCNPNKIMHAFINILDNALHAITTGGEIIVTGKVQQDEIVIYIQDSGIGMSEEIKSEIFDPFMATQSSGVGRGLYVAHEIVSQQGGSIEVESEMDKGTTHIIRLPIVKENVVGAA